MEDFKKEPQSIISEQLFIGSLLIDKNALSENAHLLSEDDFFDEKNSKIFSAIRSMAMNSQVVDHVTVAENIIYSSDAEKEQIEKYLFDILMVTTSSANIKEYSRIIREKSLFRQILGITNKINDTVYTGSHDATEVVDLAESEIYALRSGKEVKGLSHVKSVISNLYETLDELARSDSDIPGMSSGFHDLDKLTTGLNRSDLILVAARPAMGKTSFALNVALNSAKNEYKLSQDAKRQGKVYSPKKVVVFQLEMSKDQLVSRLVSSDAYIDSYKLKKGNLDPDDWSNLIDSTSKMAELEFYIDDNPSITVPEMKAKCRRLGENLGLIVIDYLQLMHSPKKTDSRVNEVSEISRSLKIMAKELDVPVICLSQLSRASEKRDEKRPMLSDLRESGAIEQDADIVAFIYRDDYYNQDSPKKDIAEIIVAKNRHGETGTADLAWIGKHTMFSNLDRRHDD